MLVKPFGGDDASHDLTLVPGHERPERAGRQFHPRTTAAPTALPCTRSRAERSGSGTCGLGPYWPQTNGEAERFIRAMLGGWAYSAIYRNSDERNAAPAGWLDFYNRRRPHGALSHKPPIARPHELNNPLGSYT